MKILQELNKKEHEALAKVVPDYEAQVKRIAAKHEISLSDAKRVVICKYLTMFAFKRELREFEAIAREEQSGELWT